MENEKQIEKCYVYDQSHHSAGSISYDENQNEKCAAGECSDVVELDLKTARAWAHSDLTGGNGTFTRRAGRNALDYFGESEWTDEQITLIEKRKNNPRWEQASYIEMATTPETWEYSDEKYDLDNNNGIDAN